MSFHGEHRGHRENEEKAEQARSACSVLSVSSVISVDEFGYNAVAGLMTMKLTRIGVLLTMSFLASTSASGESSAHLPATAPSTQSARKYAITCKLAKGSDNWDAANRKRLVDAMEAAVSLYNELGEFDKVVTANYSPGTPTAHGNYSGWLNFGGQINRRVALHEMAHALGVGQYRMWGRMIKDGKWTGEHAIAQLREFDGPDAILHADRQHFWPYGLNFDKEGGEENERRHVLMVAALRKDMGIVNGR